MKNYVFFFLLVFSWNLFSQDSIAIYTKKIEENHTFEQIINDLGKSLLLSVDEIATLQKGRKLLNAIKHGIKKNYSWPEGITDFKQAQSVMTERQIVLEY